MKTIRIKMINVLALALLLASTFFCTAFAGIENQETSASIERVTLDVIYGEQEIKTEVKPVSIFPPIVPKIETFQVKKVRLYPTYVNPEDPNQYYYDKSIYAINTISGNNWGQTNVLRVSPETTEKLHLRFIEQGYEHTSWRMEMDCYVANYQRPLRFEFVSLDGSQKILSGAYNGTVTFLLTFPTQETQNQYGNGYKGSFSFFTTSGKYTSLMAGGYVYLNDKNPEAK